MMLVRVLSSLLLRPAIAGLIGAFALSPCAVHAAQPTNAMSIAAVVNEDIITVFDVQSRLGLYLATSGLDNTPETQQRLLPQVVNALIDEHLQLQEARRLKLTTSDAEVRQSVESMESRNGMQPGAIRALLTEHGVDAN